MTLLPPHSARCSLLSASSLCLSLPLQLAILLIITIIICVRLSKLTSDLIDMHLRAAAAAPAALLSPSLPFLPLPYSSLFWQHKGKSCQFAVETESSLIEALLCECHICKVFARYLYADSVAEAQAEPRTRPGPATGPVPWPEQAPSCAHDTCNALPQPQPRFDRCLRI